MLTLFTLYLAGILVLVLELNDLKENNKIKINTNPLSFEQYILIALTSWFGWIFYKRIFKDGISEFNISIEK